MEKNTGHNRIQEEVNTYNMKKQRLVALCILTFLLIHPFGAGYIQAEESNTLHQYLDIPFDTSTPETIRQVLLEQKGLDVSLEQLETWVDGLNDFGFPLCAQFQLKGRGPGIHRILLTSAQPARVEPDQFPLRFRSDLQQFVDMDCAITAWYGQPDLRYFEGSGSTRYIFQDGKWDLPQMIALCEDQRSFYAYALWNNVVLQVWIDGKKPNVKGDYLSRILLYYEPDEKGTASMRKGTVLPYE